MNKNFYAAMNIRKATWLVFACCMLLVAITTKVNAQTNVPLRRPISPEQPMFIVHIDTWNYADPQKIIDLIPADIRPFVVMNISLSINHDETTGEYKTVAYGYETAKSWIRTCAENQMWVLVQPASGGFCHFSDFDLSVYEEFYRDYPNLLGFNYAEQFWGFDDKWSVTFPQRLNHFYELMKLNQKYGGYLVSSFCGSYYGASLNPIAMMKRDANFAAICKQDPEHFIECEKFTSTYGFSDIESTCLGTYLSGYSGQYGIRYDECGWTTTATDATYPVAAGALPTIEHVMLTGETVIDGPELIWKQCIRELSASTNSDGYKMRRWEYFPQYKNITMDIFRKILDGSFRILSRKEVIDRTKLVIINDVSTGTDQDKYSTPESLFEGLYRMSDDGAYLNNTTFFKKTGRYPAIPMVYKLGDSLANTFQVKVNKSAYATRWPSVASKVADYNTLFSQEYTGDIYAGRSENSWITYNPYKTGKMAYGSIPLKYNTCDHLDVSYSQFSLGVIKEYSDKLTFYLTNYDNYFTSLKSDTIKIYGSTAEPTYSFTDRANHQVTTITKNWADGILSLYVKHNGPLDLTVNCSGSATGRLTTYKTATIVAPKKPSVYTGPRQYEAENFNYMNISGNYTNAVGSGIKDYTGQGFLKFGTNSAASIKDTVNALKTGAYKLKIKYAASAGNVNMKLIVNGVTKIIQFSQTATESTWAYNTQSINLNSGNNVIMLTSSGSANYINFDHIIIERDDNALYNFTNDVAKTTASTPAAQVLTVQSGSAGVVSNTDSKNLTSNCIKSYSAGATNGTGVADLDLFSTSEVNSTVQWKEYYGTTGSKKGILLRGTGINGSCPYAIGMKQGYLFITQNNDDNTVTLKSFIANSNGLIEKNNYTSSFKILPNEPCWFRATAYDNQLKFECSNDSLNWVGSDATVFTDNTFTAGSTQLIWGLGADNYSWMMDDIQSFSRVVSVSRFAMSGFTAVQGTTTTTSQSFAVGGRALSDNLVVQAPEGYEVSLNSSTGYTSLLSIQPLNGIIPTTSINVRLKSGSVVKTITGNMTVSSSGTASSTIPLSGAVVPPSVKKMYDFSSDVASTIATTPPALNVTVGAGNLATAGVVSYTDATGKTSNMFKPYTGNDRNATGIFNLNAFSKTSTDYSVTWKQCLGVVAATDYKIGMVLRADPSKVGDASNYYAQGIMQGYVFIAYNVNGARTEFRTYRSTSSTSLALLSNTSVSTLIPTAGQPIWYRASVSGSSTVSLKFEYSTDSITWNAGTTSTDATAPVFTAGGTQIIWGLGVGNLEFYLDNITFNGIESATGTAVKALTKSNATVLSREYFTVTGIKVDEREAMKGLFIVRNKMSDGTVTSSKVLFN
jgi:hypothetical protein